MALASDVIFGFGIWTSIIYFLHYFRNIDLSLMMFSDKSSLSFLIILVNFFKVRIIDVGAPEFHFFLFHVIWLLGITYKIHQATNNWVLNKKSLFVAIYFAGGIFAYVMNLHYFQPQRNALSNEEEIKSKNHFVHAYDCEFITCSYLNMPFNFVRKMIFELMHSKVNITEFDINVSRISGGDGALYTLIGIDLVLALLSKYYVHRPTSSDISAKLLYLGSLAMSLWPIYVEFIEIPITHSHLDGDFKETLGASIHITRIFGALFGIVIGLFSLIFEFRLSAKENRNFKEDNVFINPYYASK